MNPELQKFDDVVASLTAPDQPFAVEHIAIDGVEYRNYSKMPAALGEYFVNMQRYLRTVNWLSFRSILHLN